jgi:peptidoglycan/xylan/chitin deacetylase (PgdA/CDA1 family)
MRALFVTWIILALAAVAAIFVIAAQISKQPAPSPTPGSLFPTLVTKITPTDVPTSTDMPSPTDALVFAPTDVPIAPSQEPTPTSMPTPDVSSTDSAGTPTPDVSITGSATPTPGGPTPTNVPKMVALTFDDGPYTPVSTRLLKLLAEYDCKATFFIVGSRVDTYSDTLRAEYNAGHQIANHTMSHANLNTLTTEKIKYEIEHSNDLINAVVPIGTCWVRPPYGNANSKVKAAATVPLINWSVDSEDWKTKDRDSIIKQIKTQVFNQSIVLCHDLYPATADAMEVIIPWLISEGYQLVTVQELLEANGIDAQPGVVYTHGRP